MCFVRFRLPMIICDLPKAPANFVLHSVTLTNKTSNKNNYSSSSIDGRQNDVCVVDLRRSSSSLSNRNRTTSISSSAQHSSPKFLESSESNSSDRFSSPQSEYDDTFTVCTSPIHGAYYKSEDIVNFIEVNRLFGAEKFIFYVDNDIHPSILNCLEAYRSQGIAELYSFSPPVLNGLHYHGQILSISDCVYRTMYRTKYLINVDLDGVIVPSKTNRNNGCEIAMQSTSKTNRQKV